MRVQTKVFLSMFLFLILGFSLFLALTGATSSRIGPSADSFVRLQEPDRNFGSSNTVRISGNYIGYLTFDLSKIPNGITFAEIILYLQEISLPRPSTIGFHVCPSSFNEETITYHNKPSYDDQAIDPQRFTSGQWEEWDVTSSMVNAKDGDSPELCFAVIDATGYDASFCSKEYNHKNQRPILYLEYRDPTLFIIVVVGMMSGLIFLYFYRTNASFNQEVTKAVSKLPSIPPIQLKNPFYLPLILLSLLELVFGIVIIWASLFYKFPEYFDIILLGLILTFLSFLQTRGLGRKFISVGVSAIEESDNRIGKDLSNKSKISSETMDSTSSQAVQDFFSSNNSNVESERHD